MCVQCWHLFVLTTPRSLVFLTHQFMTYFVTRLEPFEVDGVEWIGTYRILQHSSRLL